MRKRKEEERNKRNYHRGNPKEDEEEKVGKQTTIQDMMTKRKNRWRQRTWKELKHGRNARKMRIP